MISKTILAKYLSAIAILLPLATSVHAFDYTDYDLYSAANCASDGYDVYCDIPVTSVGGQSANRLTGVTIDPSFAPFEVEVCARSLTGISWIHCTQSKQIDRIQRVLFETEELASVRAVQPWWNHALYIHITGANTVVGHAMNELRGYTAFWVIP